MTKLNANAVGLSAGILSVIGMVTMGLLFSQGHYLEANEMMMSHHMFYDAGVTGTLLGAIEAFVISYIVGFAFAAIYNKLIPNK